MNAPEDPVVTTMRAGSTVGAVCFRIVTGDACTQRRDAERLGVADAPDIQRSFRGRDRGPRRGCRRLADLHMNDLAAGVLDARRSRHHVHHHERAAHRCGVTAQAGAVLQLYVAVFDGCLGMVCSVPRYRRIRAVCPVSRLVGRVMRDEGALTPIGRAPSVQSSTTEARRDYFHDRVRIQLANRICATPAVTRTRARPVAKRLVTVAALAAVLQPQFGAAQPGPDGPKLNVIRDAEIEELLRDYMRPILKAAKLGGQNIDVVLIGDRAFNAFVADGRRIFVNIGALYEADTPNQIIGVLAHETGHIAGGHLARLREQISTAQTASPSSPCWLRSVPRSAAPPPTRPACRRRFPG